MAPLKKLAFPSQNIPVDPIIQTAELLSIGGRSKLRVFAGRLNKRIHLDGCVIENEDFQILMNDWSQTKNLAGRYYSIGFDNVGKIEKILDLFANLPGAERMDNEETRSSQFPECFIVPIENETELNIWYEATNEEDQGYCYTRYIVKIKFAARGHAQNIE